VLDDLYTLLPTLQPDDPLRLMAASASPLLLAMHRDSNVKPYAHMQYLDKHVLALCNLQLYPDGPGPPPNVYGRTNEREGQFRYIGTGYSAAISDEAFDSRELLLLRPGVDPNSPYDPNDEVVTRLAIALPPRHGKSLLVTETLPLWFLLRHPTNTVAVSTYNQDFADEWGKSAREYLTQGKPTQVYQALPLASDGKPLIPNPGQRSDLSFRPGKDVGVIHYRGFGGTLTGGGWGLGIIDDPFKDQADALSPAVRKDKKNWYTSTFRSRTTRHRGSPPPLEIMMFTRWYEDDLAGAFAYEEDGETARKGWHVLRLPAIAEDDDPLGRQKGQSLCPELESLASLEARQLEDPTWFSCLYQGRPTHQEGSLFAKPYTYYTNTREGFQLKGGGIHISAKEPLYFVTVDLAASLKNSADFSVASAWAWHAETGTLILTDCQRDRVSTEKHADWLDRFVQRQPPDRAPSFVGIEDKTFGTNLINELRQTKPNLTVTPLKADGDKYTRALPYAEAVKSGKVWFPDPDTTPYASVWENEHAKFPNVKHDDQVDTGAYAWRKTRDYRIPASQQVSYKAPTQAEKAYLQIQKQDKKKGRSGFARVLSGG
jgi:predicted phage terminase large subunit-like protein